MDVFERQVKRLLDFVETHRETTWPEVESWEQELFSHRYHRTHADMDCCDLCLEQTAFTDLVYDALHDRFLCPDCARWARQNKQMPTDWMECESCGDPHDIDELVYDYLYGGFLCATCHHVLHEDDDEEVVLEGV